MSAESIAYFLRDHMLYMDLLLFIVALLAYKNFDNRLTLLFINVITGIFIVIISEYQAKQGNNIYMSYLMAPYEVIMMAAILYPSKEKPLARRLVWCMAILVIIINPIEGLLIEGGFQSYNSITYTLLNLLIGGLAIHHLLQLRYNPRIENLSSEPMFWVATGIAVHYIGLLVIWAFMSLAQKNSMDLLWHLALIRESVIYLTLTLWIIAFWKAKKAY